MNYPRHHCCLMKQTCDLPMFCHSVMDELPGIDRRMLEICLELGGAAPR